MVNNSNSGPVVSTLLATVVNSRDNLWRLNPSNGATEEEVAEAKEEMEEEEEEEEEGVAGNCVWFDMQKATLGPLLAWPEKDKE